MDNAVKAARSKPSKPQLRPATSFSISILVCSAYLIIVYIFVLLISETFCQPVSLLEIRCLLWDFGLSADLLTFVDLCGC